MSMRGDYTVSTDDSGETRLWGRDGRLLATLAAGGQAVMMSDGVHFLAPGGVHQCPSGKVTNPTLGKKGTLSSFLSFPHFFQPKKKVLSFFSSLTLNKDTRAKKKKRKRKKKKKRGGAGNRRRRRRRRRRRKRRKRKKEKKEKRSSPSSYPVLAFVLLVAAGLSTGFNALLAVSWDNTEASGL